MLLDELMAGTDPAEGAALARALLERLVARRSLVVATTHYGDLKTLAADDERYLNAGMEFDHETLRPSYRMRAGVPGASAALAVAERLGFPGRLVERARELVGRESLDAEQLIRDLVAEADVLIENFRPGTMERWGLGPEALHAVNPRLIMTRVSGYGQTGPYSSNPGFGAIGEAMAVAVIVAAAVLVTFVRLGTVTGIYVGLAAVGLGHAAQCIWLAWRSGDVRARFARTPAERSP